jgi:hypothetical protein
MNNINEIYKNKYFKYKIKYLNLHNKYYKKGGNPFSTIFHKMITPFRIKPSTRINRYISPQRVPHPETPPEQDMLPSKTMKDINNFKELFNIILDTYVTCVNNNALMDKDIQMKVIKQAESFNEQLKMIVNTIVEIIKTKLIQNSKIKMIQNFKIKMIDSEKPLFSEGQVLTNSDYIIVPGNAEKPGGGAVRFNLDMHYYNFKKYLQDKYIKTDIDDKICIQILKLFYNYINNVINFFEEFNTTKELKTTQEFNTTEEFETTKNIFSINIKKLIISIKLLSEDQLHNLINNMIRLILYTVIYNLKYSLCNIPLDEQCIEYLWGVIRTKTKGEINYTLDELNILYIPSEESKDNLLYSHKEKCKKILQEYSKIFNIQTNGIDDIDDFKSYMKNYIIDKNLMKLQKDSNYRGKCLYNKKEITMQYTDVKENNTFGGTVMSEAQIKQYLKILFSWGIINNCKLPNKSIQCKLIQNKYYNVCENGKKITESTIESKFMETGDEYNICFLMKNSEKANLLFTFTPNYADKGERFPASHIISINSISPELKNEWIEYNKRCLEQAYRACINKFIDDISKSNGNAVLYIPRIGDGLYKINFDPNHEGTYKDIVSNAIKSCILEKLERGVISNINSKDDSTYDITFNTNVTVNVKFISLINISE